MATIHPTATVDSACELADDVTVGPWCVLEGRVQLASGVTVMGNNYLRGPLTVGAGTTIYPFACLGFPAQHRRVEPGAPNAGIRIGRECVIREHVTVHSSTGEEQATRIGDEVYMMCYSHVGHDCLIGNRVTLVNSAQCAGHVTLGDDVTLGGGALVHQFCRIGRLAMMRGGVGVNQDVPPFCLVQELNRLGGTNDVGLRRSGMPRDEITAVRKAYRLYLHQPLPRKLAVAGLRSIAEGFEAVEEIAAFLETSERGVAPGMSRGPRGT